MIILKAQKTNKKITIMASDEIKLKKIGYNKWANDEYQVDVDSGFVCGYHIIMPSHAPSLTIACVIFRLGNKKKLFNITDDSYKRPPIDFTCDGPLNDYDCYICPKSEKKNNSISKYVKTTLFQHKKKLQCRMNQKLTITVKVVSKH